MRRGLIKRENKIKLLLQSEDLDILYLTETDTKKDMEHLSIMNIEYNEYRCYLQVDFKL